MIPVNIADFFNSFWENLTNSSLRILPGILLLLVSLLGAWLLAFLVRVLLNLVRLNKLVEKTNMMQVLQSAGLDFKLHLFLSRLVFWIVFLILVETVARASGWTTVTSKFEEYFLLLPVLIGGLIIVIAGLYLSRFIRNSVHAILKHASPDSANVLSNVVFYILLTIIITFTLGYIGFDTGIITTNITIILGSLLLAFSLSFVFAAKEIMGHILSSSYNKKQLKVGQKIVIGEHKGEIIKLTNVSVIIKTDNRIEVIPAKRFTDEVVKIIG